MSNFIFEHNPGKKEISDIKYYTMIGTEDYVDDDGYPRTNNENNHNVVAKAITKDNGKIRYTIKIGTNNKLMNPISIYGKEKESAFLDSVCRASNKFIDVNLKIFELYLNFLKTKNTSWLYNAEREMT